MIGMKTNRKPVLMGAKLNLASKLIGIKNLSKVAETVNSKRDADITQMDSNIIDSQKMPTGIDKNNRRKSSRNGLERGNRQTE
jgi:hypothetical protein